MIEIISLREQYKHGVINEEEYKEEMQKAMLKTAEALMSTPGSDIDD